MLREGRQHRVCSHAPGLGECAWTPTVNPRRRSSSGVVAVAARQAIVGEATVAELHQLRVQAATRHQKGPQRQLQDLEAAARRQAATHQLQVLEATMAQMQMQRQWQRCPVTRCHQRCHHRQLSSPTQMQMQRQRCPLYHHRQLSSPSLSLIVRKPSIGVHTIQASGQGSTSIIRHRTRGLHMGNGKCCAITTSLTTTQRARGV